MSRKIAYFIYDNRVYISLIFFSFFEKHREKKKDLFIERCDLKRERAAIQNYMEGGLVEIAPIKKRKEHFFGCLLIGNREGQKCTHK